MDSYVPRHQLRDRVVSIERVMSDGHSSRVLPTAGAVLGLQMAGRVLSPDGPLSALGVTGIPDGARRYCYQGPAETFLVRFRPQGATCLGLPAHLLRGKSLSLDQLWEAPGRARSANLMDEMLSSSNPTHRVALLEDFLAELPFRRDMRLEQALKLLSRPVKNDVGGQVALASRELRLSSRQLERLFLERVGVSPKRYARLRRFERAVHLARAGRPLGEVAFASGYSDQAHFIREFRSLTGEAPRSFLKSGEFVL